MVTRTLIILMVVLSSKSFAFAGGVGGGGGGPGVAAEILKDFVFVEKLDFLRLQNEANSLGEVTIRGQGMPVIWVEENRFIEIVDKNDEIKKVYSVEIIKED